MTEDVGSDSAMSLPRQIGLALVLVLAFVVAFPFVALVIGNEPTWFLATILLLALVLRRLVSRRRTPAAQPGASDIRRR